MHVFGYVVPASIFLWIPIRLWLARSRRQRWHEEQQPWGQDEKDYLR